MREEDHDLLDRGDDPDNEEGLGDELALRLTVDTDSAEELDQDEHEEEAIDALVTAPKVPPSSSLKQLVTHSDRA